MDLSTIIKNIKPLEVFDFKDIDIKGNANHTIKYPL